MNHVSSDNALIDTADQLLAEAEALAQSTAPVEPEKKKNAPKKLKTIENNKACTAPSALEDPGKKVGKRFVDRECPKGWKWKQIERISGMLEWNVRVPRPGRIKHSIPVATLLLEIGQLRLRDGFGQLLSGSIGEVAAVQAANIRGKGAKESVEYKSGV